MGSDAMTEGAGSAPAGDMAPDRSVPTPGHYGFALGWFVLVAAIFLAPVASGRSFSVVEARMADNHPWAAQLDGVVEGSPAQFDSADLSVPWQRQLDDALDTGTLAFWSPDVFGGGAPLYANGTSAQLYPPRLLLTLVAPERWFHDLWVAFHLIVGGFSAYLLGRELARSHPAALVGSTAWMLGSFNLGWAHLEVVTPMMVGVPLSLFLVHRAWRRRTIASASTAAAGLAVILVSGHLLWMLFTWEMAAIYAGCLGVTRAARSRPRGLRGAARVALAEVWIPLVSFGGGVALASVVLLPSLANLTRTPRTPFDVSALSSFLASPRLVTSWLWWPPPHDPMTTEVMNGRLAFVGSVTAALAVVGLVSRRGGSGLARGIVVTTIVVMCWLPAARLAYELVPGMNVMYPYARFAGWLAIGIVVASMVGFDVLIDAMTRWRRPERHPTRRQLEWAVAGLVVLVAVGQLIPLGRGLNPAFQSRDDQSWYPSTPVVEAAAALPDHNGWEARIAPLTTDYAGLTPGGPPILWANHPVMLGLDSLSGYDSTLPEPAAQMLRSLAGDDPAFVVDHPLVGAYVPVFEFHRSRLDAARVGRHRCGDGRSRDRRAGCRPRGAGGVPGRPQRPRRIAVGPRPRRVGSVSRGIGRGGGIVTPRHPVGHPRPAAGRRHRRHLLGRRGASRRVRRARRGLRRGPHSRTGHQLDRSRGGLRRAGPARRPRQHRPRMGRDGRRRARTHRGRRALPHGDRGSPGCQFGRVPLPATVVPARPGGHGPVRPDARCGVVAGAVTPPPDRIRRPERPRIDPARRLGWRVVPRRVSPPVAWLDRLRVGDAVLALVSYVPLLLTHPGQLGADTKAYLYIDPGRLMSRAPFLWDPSVGLGTVTHQNIGYLFPMGPYYWIAERLGVPDWLAQRFWFGSIIFLAGLGVRYLLRTLRWEGPGVTVASLAYALSPYLLHYIYKHSVILLPFSALPWLVALTVRSLRHPGWRYPARFALIVLVAGGINATSLILVLIGPALWVLHAVFVEREIPFRAVVPVAARIAVLTLGTSLWWMAGLLLQGRYGLNILNYTETYTTVADASSSAEVGRSLGYWFFYGIDTLGPWFGSAETMTQVIPAVALSFLVPLVCLAGAVWTRFRYRIFFVAMALAGMVVSVGAHPVDSPSPYGAVFAAFTETDSGLALRSTPRAVPLLALSLAVFLGAGVAALSRVYVGRRLWFAVPAMVMVMANLSPLFTGDMIDPFLERPNDLPAYWHQVGDRLDAGDAATRTLEIPGIEFANYRWGASVDPVTPGLTDRDYAARELFPYGTAGAADLMNAIDVPLQDGTFSPSGYAPLLRLLGVGDLVLRSDLQYERFRTPRPALTFDKIEDVAGLGDGEPFGPDTPNRAPASSPLLDDLELSRPPDLIEPNAVTVYPVEDPLPILRTVDAGAPVLVSGDGAGLVATSEAGLLDPERMVIYSGSVTDSADDLDRVLAAGADIIITDSNRKAGRRWGSTKDNDGLTETADEMPPEDPSDNRLDIFGRSDTDVQTVTIQEGGLRASASGYGNPLTFTPGDRAAKAFDGDLTTSWRVGAFSDVRGESLTVRVTDGGTFLDDNPSATVRLTQASGPVNRHIARLRVTGADDLSVDIDLDEASWEGQGQSVVLPRELLDGDHLVFTVIATDRDNVATYQGLSGVGFAEVDVGETRSLTEVVRPPVDLLDAVEEREMSLDDRSVSWVFRRRIAPPDSGAVDEETMLIRRLTTPTPLDLEVVGSARVNPDIADDELDALLGRDPTADRWRSSSGLRGDAFWRASKVADGSDATGWQSRLNPEAGEWVEASSVEPRERGWSSVTFLADGRHSLPAAMHLEVDGVRGADVAVDGSPATAPGGTFTVELPPVEGPAQQVRLVIDSFTDVTAPDWLTGLPVRMPIGIAEIDGAAGPSDESSTVSPLPDVCRDDLVFVDGEPVSVRAAGSIGDAERGRLLNLVACGTEPVAVDRGSHLVTTADGRSAGIDVDLLVLSNANGVPSPSTTPPETTVTSQGRTTSEIEVRDADRPYWLVLGQSLNDGWVLEIDGVDQGAPRLVNGYANGWYVDPAEVGSDVSMRLEWAPQKWVWWALVLSAVGFVAALGLSLRPARPTAVGTSQAMRPLPVGIFDAFGRPPSLRPTVLVASGSGVLGLVLIDLRFGLLTALVAIAALRTAWGWRALRLLVVASWGLVGAFVVAKQVRNGFPLDFDWPQHFDAVNSLGLLAYVLLAVDAVVEAVRGGWRRDADVQS